MVKKLLMAFVTIAVFVIVGFEAKKYYEEYKIANAKVIVNLKDNLEIEAFSDAKLSDFITYINGELIDDYQINTTTLGQKPLDFKYINEEGIKVEFSFVVNVVDKVEPLISGAKSLTITKGDTSDITKKLFCGDNFSVPKCEFKGYYDVNKVGEYPVTFTATDASGNVATNDLTIYVREKSNSSSSSQTSQTYQNFSDIVAKYKADNTKFGLDISRWQGDINFQKVKDAGVEFVFIRVGSQRGIGEEYFVDPKFEQNIKGFQSVGIPVGVYYYSYANNIEAAKKEAEWVVEQLKPYKLELPVAFDWENWSFYQEFNLSFYDLTEVAKTFLGIVEKAGYKGMIYSSKNYLENVWFKTKYPTWLAHYTEQTTYKGEYKVWQLCSNGRIPGIYGNVDVNIMYN